MCMSCVKNCEREVPELNFRPIGFDYGLPWLLPPMLQSSENLSVSQVETNYWLGALVTVLQGSVLVHYMPQLLSELGLDATIAVAPPAFDMPFLAHSVFTGILLATPGLLSLGVDKISAPLESVITTWQSKLASNDDKSKRHVLIDLYETIMNSNQPIQETLSEFDPDGDGIVSCWECKQALDHLEIPEEQCETLMSLMKQRFGDVDNISITAWLDYFQELYTQAKESEMDISENDTSHLSKLLGQELQTKKTFVEIFNELDINGDGYIVEEEFSSLFGSKYLSTPLTFGERSALFRQADVLGKGRLNLFEFMSAMRKIVRVGIQEIGYGYLPLAWASLTAYWLGIGLTEFGLLLERLPDTFYLDAATAPLSLSLLSHISLSASPETVQAVQATLMLVAVPVSIGFTQKLCADNKIGRVRFGLHAAVQVVGALLTLHLMTMAQNCNITFPVDTCTNKTRGTIVLPCMVWLFGGMPDEFTLASRQLQWCL